MTPCSSGNGGNCAGSPSGPARKAAPAGPSAVSAIPISCSGSTSPAEDPPSEQPNDPPRLEDDERDEPSAEMEAPRFAGQVLITLADPEDDEDDIERLRELFPRTVSVLERG